MHKLARSLLVAGSAAVGTYCAAQALVRRSRWCDFAGKTVFITGGSRGLGLVLARHLVDRGARVAICARTEADLQTAAAKLRARGGEILPLVCDVRNFDEVQHVVSEIRDKWGPVDVLLNVAGVIAVGPLETLTLDDFHEAMDTNCWGALHTILAVLPDMRHRQWGRIVNVASIGGKQAVPHLIPYDTSKFALVGLSTGLRTELAQHGILVTTASPTLMRTGSARNATFKGHHRQEYAWFSIGSGLPIVSMDSDRAAQQLEACQAGDADVFITNLLNPPVWAARLLPTLTTEVLSLINRVLPPPGGIGRSHARGYESESFIAPSWLTTRAEAAAVRNNEK